MSPRSGPVVALVLAAGGSTRLGRPKQLEVVGGVPLVVHALRAARGADEVVLVTGAHADRVEAVACAAGAPACEVLRVEGWERGMGHVLARAVGSVRTRAAAVVVLLGDQPGVERSAVVDVVAAWRDGAGPVVAARYAEGTGHPRLFDAQLFAELTELDGDAGGRGVVQRWGEVPVDVTGSMHDVDDEASLQEAIRVSERRS